MYLDLLEPVKLGESVQWVRVRSAAPGNPLLLLIQQGPGLPMINEIGEFGRLLRLEAHFTVPYGTRRSPLLGRRSDGSRLGSEARVSRSGTALRSPRSSRPGTRWCCGRCRGRTP